MENLRLSWDLFIIVFFGIVITYSFIIGRNQTIKLIIATYMAILTADGLGNIFNTYLLPAAPALQGETGEQTSVLLKIFVFVVVIVLLAIKGGFRIDMLPEQNLLVRILSNLSFGFLSAGLMVSTLLVYLTGGSFIEGALTAANTNIYLESQAVQVLIDNYSIWFAIPAVSIVIISFFEPTEG